MDDVIRSVAIGGLVGLGLGVALAAAAFVTGFVREARRQARGEDRVELVNLSVANDLDLPSGSRLRRPFKVANRSPVRTATVTVTLEGVTESDRGEAFLSTDSPSVDVVGWNQLSVELEPGASSPWLYVVLAPGSELGMWPVFRVTVRPRWGILRHPQRRGPS